MSSMGVKIQTAHGMGLVRDSFELVAISYVLIAGWRTLERNVWGFGFLGTIILA